MRRETIDSILKDVLDQLPDVEASAIDVIPANPLPGNHVLIRIEVGPSHCIFCEIDPEGRLQSARVIMS